MYDELIGELYLTASMARSKSKRELLEKAADAIEELQAAEKKYLANISALETENQHLKRERAWIPVTERLPEAGERVLCYCRANIYEVMKMRTDGDWVYDTNHIYMHSFVTHWMPLPSTEGLNET